jgi:hypothetical protein
MRLEESAEPPAAPKQSTPSSEPPVDEEQVRLMLKHAERFGQRRERRRWLIAIGTLAGLVGLLTVIVSGGRLLRHQAAVPKPAVPLHESSEPRAAPSEPQAPRGDVAPPASGPPSVRPPAAPGGHVSYQPHERLITLRPGDTKERVFDLFGTTVEQQSGSVVRMEGMRLRARGRSVSYAKVEVAEVTLADGTEGGLYWFLFGDDRLLAWGQPKEWLAAAGHHQLDIDYRPGSSVAIRTDREPSRR